METYIMHRLGVLEANLASKHPKTSQLNVSLARALN